MKKIKTFIPTYEKIINSCYAEYFNVLHTPVIIQVEMEACVFNYV